LEAEQLQNWGDWQHMAARIRQTAAAHRQHVARRAEDPILVELLAQRLVAIDIAPLRNRLNKDIWKRRRILKRWEETRKVMECAATGAAPRKTQSRHINWGAIVGDTEPEVALTNFFTSIFDLPPAERLAAEQGRLLRITIARDLAIDNGRPLVTRKSLDSALARLKRGKGSADGVSAEMLQALPEAARNSLTSDLAARCAKLDFPPEWCTSRISLAPKTFGVTSLSGFRPIAGLVTMRKLLGYLWLNSLPQIVFFSIQTAFVPGSHADTGPFLLNRSAELAREWRFPLAIAQVDIHKAFDHVRHEACFEAMKRKNFSPYTIALIAAIWSATTVIVSLGHCSSDVIGMNRGLPQGAPESSMIFTLLIDMVITNVSEKWRRNGWGFSVDDFHVSAIAYADDIVLVAHSPEHLQFMVADIVHELQAIGLGIGAAKTHWTSTPPLEDTHLDIVGSQVKWETSITFVGTIVDLSGTSAPAISHRMAQADKCFAKWRGVLTSPHVSLKRRLAILPATVWNAFLWSASTWTTTKAQRAQIASWGARIVSKVARVKRRADVDGATHWRLVHRIGHSLAAQHKIAIAPRAKLRALSWAGHIARLSPKAPAAAAMRCRGMQWWRWKQFQISSVSQVPGARGAHPRRYKIQRWEDLVSGLFGEGFAEDTASNTGWLAAAQHRTSWRVAAASAAASA
jgi:hypothetical protein